MTKEKENEILAVIYEWRDNPTFTTEMMIREVETLWPSHAQGVKQSAGVSKELAIKILAIRDEFAKCDYDEAYHILYSIASPEFNKDEPWKELEKIAASESPSEPLPNLLQEDVDTLTDKLEKAEKSSSQWAAKCMEKHAEHVKLQLENERLRAVLKELVELKDMKDYLEDVEIEQMPEDWTEKHKDYLTRKPLAWEAARKELNT